MEFLCGKVYEVLTNELYKEIEKTNTRYEILFSEYINFTYNEEPSMVTIWNLYKNNVLPFEKILGKYLWQMNPDELKEIIMSIPSDSYSLKHSVFIMCEQFLNWCIGYKNLITINNINALDKDEIIKLNPNALKKTLYGIDNFWKLIDSMIKKSDIQWVAPLVFGRYGITDMDYQMNLKMDNIDKEKKEVYVVDNEGEIKVILSVDDRFIEFCKKLNTVKGYEGEYLIKVKENGGKRTVSLIYGRIRRACVENDIGVLKINNMFRCRFLDFLLDIRKERFLNRNDFSKLMQDFRPGSSAGRYMTLVKFYETITGEETLRGGKKVNDPNGVKFVSDLKKDLCYY